MMGRFSAKVVKVQARTWYNSAQYRVELYFDGKFLVDYRRSGRASAYALKKSYEATGICPAS